jgi:hypothetical protein
MPDSVFPALHRAPDEFVRDMRIEAAVQSRGSPAWSNGKRTLAQPSHTFSFLETQRERRSIVAANHGES